MIKTRPKSKAKKTISRGVVTKPEPAKAKAKAPAKKSAATKKEGVSVTLGKRAQALADAQAGKVPPAPDFSAPTHAPYVKKLEELQTMIARRDLAGLKKFKINPTSTSPKALARYRDLAVIALTAKAA